MVVYNIVPSSSLGVDPTGRYSGLGYSTVSHELLHSLGAPDLYRTTGDLGEPVGIWDHMAKRLLQPAIRWYIPERTLAGFRMQIFLR